MSEYNFIDARARRMARMAEELSRDRSGIIEIAEATTACKEPRFEDHESLQEGGKSWFKGRTLARLQNLELLKHHRVYKTGVPPAGTRVMSHRWMDKDYFAESKSRFTCRGYEQQLAGAENFHAATPREATLRMLLILVEIWDIAVAVGGAAQAFLQAPFREETPVYVKPVEEAGEPPGVAWRLLKTLPGLKGDPAAWGDYSSEVLENTYKSSPSKHEPCVYSHQEGGL